MRCPSLSIAVLVVLGAALACAKTIRVEVGQERRTPIHPRYYSVLLRGDIVEFHFDAVHSVVAGDFSEALHTGGKRGILFRHDAPNCRQTLVSSLLTEV